MHNLLDTLAQVVEDQGADESDLEHFVRPLLGLLSDVTGLESTYLTSIDQERAFQKIMFATNTNDEPLIPEGLQVPWRDTLCKRSLDDGRIFTGNVAGVWGDSDAARELGITTYVSQPVQGVNGEVVGTLCGASRTSQDVGEEALRLLGVCAKLISWQLQRSELIAKLHEQNQAYAASALLDPLTGVFNRRGLEKEMKRAQSVVKRTSQPFHLAFIDLDNFKYINDTYGHDAGDRFLLQLCERLRTILRQGDVLARVGGDEFVVLGWPSTMQVDDLPAFKERLSQAIIGTYLLEDKVVDYAGASIGVVSAQFDESDEAILERADAEMYADKKRRKSKTKATT
ncbi:GGDEF domain-containing protein [Aliidiomarina indica]|uniref:GGDEF domain-containing protein n=1 Tax=Aliidiomarina indica TaxID=2749147 RepID=UPI00188E2387|nr:sensor domain-containing diguanylate cyclase [Aliidiomarina indica]